MRRIATAIVWALFSTLALSREARAQEPALDLPERIPEFLRGHGVLEIELWQWVGLALCVLVAYGLGVLVARLAIRGLGRLSERTRARWDDHAARALRGPSRLIVAVLVMWPLVDGLALAEEPAGAVEAVQKILLIAAVAWLATRFVGAVARAAAERAVEAGPDDLDERAAYTQAAVLRRVLAVVIWVVAGALVLLQFEVVRDVGLSLLASAGLAGVVLGFAAQKSLANLLAGIQLSFAQPIRIGDVVVVEGEWGRIEEINLTYVVVKIWDLRRLVVPVSYFIEKPFENWTRTSAQVLGAVFVEADYRVPVERVREELVRYVKGQALWDGETCGLVVTDAVGGTVRLRALVSAANSNKLWDLRCALREHLVGYLRDLDGGRYLPRGRWEKTGSAAAEA